VPAVLAAAGLSACGSSTHDKVAHYIDQANAIQARSAADVQRANAAYAQFSRGKLTGLPAADALTQAEDGIRATRDQLAGLHPPPPAARLNRLLLRVYQDDAELASESAALARYLPAAAAAVRPLGAMGTTLRRRLRAAAGPTAQAAALASYAHGIAAVEKSARDLQPPPVLVSSYRAQLARLLSARSLARRLRTALRQGNARAVATLLVEFRSLNARAGARPSLDRASLLAYTQRYEAIARAVQDMQRERARLQASLS